MGVETVADLLVFLIVLVIGLPLLTVSPAVFSVWLAATVAFSIHRKSGHG